MSKKQQNNATRSDNTARDVNPPIELASSVPPHIVADALDGHKPLRHLRRIATKVIGETRVHLVDTAGPQSGRLVGVELEFADPGSRPSDAVKAILREGDAPLGYRPQVKAWVRRVGDAPVEERMNAEMRWADCVQVLRNEAEKGR